MRTRVLFVIKSLAHFSYVSSIIAELDKTCRVELLFNERWSSRGGLKLINQSRRVVLEFIRHSNNVTLNGWTVERTANRWIFPLREIRSYISYIRRKDQSEYYLKRWNGYLPLRLSKLFSYRIVKFLLSLFPNYELLTLIEKCVPSDRGIIEDLIKRKPDVVVATPINHRFSEEIEYVKAAKSLGIPTVTTALTWDSLSTKGVFHVIPDLTLVWNEMQKQEAIQIHGVSRDKVRVTGAPFFDKWFDSDLDEGRDLFCERMGLDPDKPFVLYLGSSANIAMDETALIQKIYDNIGWNMLVRPHPANSKNYSKLSGNKGMCIQGGVLPVSESEQKDFHNAIRHCEFALGVNTSAMIDVIIHDKECISVGDREYKNTQGDTAHFKHMVSALGLHGKRKEFIRKYIRPHGFAISAGIMAARAIKYEAIHRGR